MKKKRALTLIEVMIALTLCGILLTSLFHFVHQTLSSNIKLQKVKDKVLSRQCMHERLSSLFSRVATKSTLGKGTTLYTTPEGLFFKTTHAIDADPRFCGELAHLLYVDHTHKSLCLVTWSKNQERRHEVLLSHVSELDLQLFNEQHGWKTSWSKEEGNLPSMIRLKIPQQNLEFGYFL
jgi:prepilin-type N-terminal cleavage/methylation domain-containing protein